MSDAIPTLSRREQHAYLLEKFRRGIDDAGGALLHIHHYRTYLDDYPTFEAFCVGELKMSVRRGYQLLEYTGFVEQIVAENVHHGAHPQPPVQVSERQYRDAFKNVPSEVRQDAVRHAIETAPNGRPTVEHLGKVAKGFERAARPSPYKAEPHFSEPTETEQLRARIAELEAALHEVLAAEEAARTNRHGGGVLERWRLALSRLRALIAKPHHTADAGNMMPRYDA